MDAQVQILIEQTLTRACSNERERAHLARRPLHADTHAKIHAALTTAYAAHQLALKAIYAKVASSVNLLAPVNTLPSDILLDIFARMDVKARITASRVCVHWRTTALDSATLWNTLNLTVRKGKTTALSELLRRTKDAPVNLSLDVFGTTRDVADVQQILSPAFQRLRTLALRIQCEIDELDESEEENHQDAAEMPIPSAPTLREARLVSFCDQLGHPTARFKFSSAPDSYVALQSLAIGPADGVTLRSWPSIPGLHRLHYQCADDKTVTMRRLLDMVRGSPLLEHLVLENIPNVIEATSTGTPISLPNLRTLSLSGTFRTDSEIFQHLLVALASRSRSIKVLRIASRNSEAVSFSWFTAENTSTPESLYCITRMSLGPRDPGYEHGHTDSTMYALRVDYVQGPRRFLSDIRNPAALALGIFSSIRLLAVDGHFWSSLPEHTEFPTLETLVVVGLPPRDRAGAKARVSSLRHLWLYIGRRQGRKFWSESWSAYDVVFFLNEEIIRDHDGPMERIVVRTGYLQDDYSIPQIERYLEQYAKSVEIDETDVGFKEFSAILDWFPDPSTWQLQPGIDE